MNALPADATPPTGRGEHVLYVDDEASLGLLVRRMLERLGYRCTTHTDAQAALQAVRSAPREFDAVVTDLIMPAMTGLEFARALRDIRPDLPVALASGDLPGDPESLREDGVSASLHKPLTLDDLARTLRRMLPTSRR